MENDERQLDSETLKALAKTGPEGIVEWNRRVEEQKDAPQLRNTELDHLQLEKIDLGLADLAMADLSFSNLNGATISFCDLSGSNLSYAKLEHADLRDSNLANANLTKSNLSSVNLVNANLSNADLLNAELRGANLSHANLKGANTVGVEFFEVNLYNANLENCDLRHIGKAYGRINNPTITIVMDQENNVIKSRPDFIASAKRFMSQYYKIDSPKDVFPVLRPRPFILDQTRTRNARISPQSQDPWSVLRRTYTGSRLAFLLLFTAVAFLPLFIQAFFWTSINKAERGLFPIGVRTLDRAVEFLERQNDPTLQEWEWGNRAKAFIKITKNKRGQTNQLDDPPVSIEEVETLVRLLNEGRQAIRKLEKPRKIPDSLLELQEIDFWFDVALGYVNVRFPDTKIHLRERKIWQLLLGTDQDRGALYLRIVLILYNTIRAWLTYSVSPLRDEEERSGDSPAYLEYLKLWEAHRVLSFLVIVAYLSAAVEIWNIITTSVLVPF